MTSIPIDEFGGPEGESFRFERIGDTAKGVIVHAEKIRRKSQFKPFPMQEVLRIVLEDANGENIVLWPVLNSDIDGDGYADRMAKAIGAALRAEQARSLDAGGILAVRYSEEVPTEMGNPARGFQSQYQKPKAIPGGEPFEQTDPDGAVTGLI